MDRLGGAQHRRRAPLAHNLRNLVCLGVLSLAACDETRVQSRKLGLLPGEEQANARAPKTEAPASKPEPPPFRPLPSNLRAGPDPGALSKPADAPPGGDTGAPAAEAAPPEPPPRDLSGELASAFGQPLSCLDAAAVASGGGRLTVTITAYLMPSGRITRASASAPGQPSEAITCLEKRASALSLRGPIDDAPRQVSAALPVEVVTRSSP